MPSVTHGLQGIGLAGRRGWGSARGAGARAGADHDRAAAALGDAVVRGVQDVALDRETQRFRAPLERRVLGECAAARGRSPSRTPAARSSSARRYSRPQRSSLESDRLAIERREALAGRPTDDDVGPREGSTSSILPAGDVVAEVRRVRRRPRRVDLDREDRLKRRCPRTPGHPAAAGEQVHERQHSSTICTRPAARTRAGAPPPGRSRRPRPRTLRSRARRCSTASWCPKSHRGRSAGRAVRLSASGSRVSVAALVRGERALDPA